MNRISLFLLIPVLALTGCETLQTPQQRQQAATREKNARLYADDQLRRVKGQIESVEAENARLMEELQRLRREVSSYNSQMAQLNSKMNSLEAKQQQEMNNLVREVKALLTKVARPPARQQQQTRGAGFEHTVEKGHTLSTIAQAYGTSVKAIKQANNLKSDTIRIGQKLFIPE